MVERDVPHMARARFDSPRGVTVMALASTTSVTSSGAENFNSPLAPLTAIVWPSRRAVTPLGITTGFFPTRDMAYSPLMADSTFKLSEHLAQHFAADILFAGNVVGHDPFGRRHNGNAQAIGH